MTVKSSGEVFEAAFLGHCGSALLTKWAHYRHCVPMLFLKGKFHPKDTLLSQEKKSTLDPLGHMIGQFPLAFAKAVILQ